METMTETDDRAAQLHKESLVIDTLSGFGPTLYTPDMLVRMEEMVARESLPSDIVVEMDSAKHRNLVQGRIPEFWTDWDATGVDVVSVTLGGFGTRFFTYENALRDLALYTEVFDQFPDRVIKIRSAADAEEAHRSGKKGIILNFQNTTHLNDDLANLEFFYRLGLRVILLTYNARNSVGDGCTERVQAGLSHFGVQVVKAMNEMGILVDLAHCSDATAMDAIEISAKPVAITHSFSKELGRHDRGKGEHVIRAVGEQGGYFGVCIVPFFLTDKRDVTLDDWLLHVDRAVELAGIDHVGIGTDWGEEIPEPMVKLLDGEVRRIGFRDEHRVDWGATTDGFRSWREWPNLTRALVGRGYSDDEVRGLLGQNFLRVFREAVG